MGEVVDVEKGTVEYLAAVILRERREFMARQYSQEQADWERVEVTAGRKYVRVDVGPEHNMSGKYMVDVETGIIYGIKGYGQVHKGHRYGTLETVDEWCWGGYTAQRVSR